MEWLSDRKNRLTVSILAAMAAAILVAGGFRLPQYPAASAWWGPMYPEFCFSEGSGDCGKAPQSYQCRNGDLYL